MQFMYWNKGRSLLFVSSRAAPRCSVETDIAYFYLCDLTAVRKNYELCHAKPVFTVFYKGRVSS